MTTHEMIIVLNEYAGVSMETINCMTSIDGYNKETCVDILYWATGYENFNEYLKDIEENA